MIRNDAKAKEYLRVACNAVQNGRYGTAEGVVKQLPADEPELRVQVLTDASNIAPETIGVDLARSTGSRVALDVKSASGHSFHRICVTH